MGASWLLFVQGGSRFFDLVVNGRVYAIYLHRMSWSPVRIRSDKATISKMGCWIIDDLGLKSQVYPGLTHDDGTKITKSPAWIVADLY